MGLTANTVAAALCRGEVPNREIAGVLYLDAELSEPIAMPTPPDATSVARAGKTSWVKQVTALRSKVPEFLGKDGAKGKSKASKRAYIAHGTDPDALAALEHIAMEGSESAQTWARRMEPGRMLERLAAAEYPTHVIEKAGEGLAEHHMENDPRTNRLARRTQTALLTGSVRHLLANGELERTEALLARATVQARVAALEASMQGGGTKVTAEMMAMIERSVGTKAATEIVADSWGISVEDEVIRLIVERAPELAESLLDDEFALRNIAWLSGVGEDEAVKMVLHVAMGNQVDPEHVNTALLAHAGRGERHEQRFTHEFLLEYQHELDEHAVLHYLRNCDDPEAVETWLAGGGASRPTDAAVAALCADPGHAFGRKGAALGHILEWHLEEILRHRWADTIVETVGPEATRVIVSAANQEYQHETGEPGNAAGRYLARRFTEAFGENVEAWRAAVSMVATSTQPLGRTLRAAASIHRVGR